MTRLDYEKKDYAITVVSVNLKSSDKTRLLLPLFLYVNIITYPEIGSLLSLNQI